MLSGAGDELQGIKRGIIEIADALIITKADGANIQPAKLAAATYKNALHLFPPTPNGWIPRVATCSIIDNEGIREIWDMIQSFHNAMQLNGHLDVERKRQSTYWMHEKIKSDLFDHFYQLPKIKSRLSELEKLVESNKLSPTAAAKELLNNFQQS
jgi:LAO/AO transport system kinase